ncbi:trypsin-like serine peptidase [Roseovarius sp. 2305UL8-3]|uniref:trypsin-like serine peptidase n=1 Tax=Roseovarius conchicola TaxID=3121636 RepID=UPI0035276865
MRRFHHIVFAALAVLIVAIPAVPLSAGNGLIRLTDRDDLFGWEGVGRVDIKGGAYCTGVLIAPNLVLTAAHCVYDPQGRLRAADSLMFRAGLADGQALAEQPVRRIAAHKSFDPRVSFGTRTIRYDAALLELAAPIPTSVADPFILQKHAGKGQDVSVVSYGRGRDEALSWQRECSVLGRAEGLIAFDCNVTYGSSGAPVFVREGGRARILTLISGGEVKDGPRMAFGMDLPPLLDQLKRDLRAMPKATASSTGLRRVKIGEGGTASGAKFAKP